MLYCHFWRNPLKRIRIGTIKRIRISDRFRYIYIVIDIHNRATLWCSQKIIWHCEGFSPNIKLSQLQIDISSSIWIDFLPILFLVLSSFFSIFYVSIPCLLPISLLFKFFWFPNKKYSM